MAQTMAYQFGVDDDHSAALILQMQLQDLEDITTNAKGKGREDVADDIDFALRMYKEELERCVNSLSDRRMTQSIAQAVQSDGFVLSSALQAEDLIARDKELARRIADGINGPTTHPTPPDLGDEDILDDELLAKLDVRYNCGVDDHFSSPYDEDSEDEQAGPSNYSRARKRANEDRVCQVCRESAKFYDIARLPCRHDYCRDCVVQLFQSSMSDESLFPPRCCRQPIPMGTVSIFLKTELKQRFNERKKELESANRTYCHRSSCGRFVPPEAIENDVAVCRACETQTCVICKNAAHMGDCPDDEALQQLLGVANESGWQRCYSCRRLVELDLGCNHISCRCGAQFCYVCGQRWKTCGCGQWDEQRLYRRAVQIYDRDPAPDQRQHRPVAPAIVNDLGPVEVEEVDEGELHEPVEAPPPPIPQPAYENDDMDSLDELAAAEAVGDVVTHHHPEEPAEPPSVGTPEDDAADRDIAGTPVADVTSAVGRRNIAIAELVRDLRERHECSHNNWRWVSGAHRCEECWFFLPKYIFECRQCRIRACNRCKLNRL